MTETTTLRDIIRPGTTRKLDFIIVGELRKRTSINPESVLKFALGEMLCNALDTDATEINIQIGIEYPSFARLEVQDNGSQKLSRKDLEMILDFESKASSKRGFLMVSRGYLGNALKCIFGYSYALAEAKGLVPPDIVIASKGCEYRITLKPDRISEVINSRVKEKSQVRGIERAGRGFYPAPQLIQLYKVFFSSRLSSLTRLEKDLPKNSGDKDDDNNG